MSKLTKFSSEDIISDLPESIIDSILTKLPVKDAVRTCVLSSKWKYQWTTMTQLVFDEKCLCLSNDKKVAEKELVDFVMRFLLLHDGPIQKFKLSTSYLQKSTDIDQWLRVISRKNIKEIVLDVYGGKWRWSDPRFSTPRSIFSLRKLTGLTLSEFAVKPPLGFQGFPCIKYLELHGVTITLEVIENLISGCPLLEKFKFSHWNKLAFAIRAPNLKLLTVKGNLEDFYLEHTPLVVAFSINFYPLAWRGNVLKKVPVTYDYLKFIEIGKMDFKDTDEVLYVLQLLLQSPNLQDLQISSPDLEMEEREIIACGEEPNDFQYRTADFDIWERNCPTDFTFKCLKTVKLSYICTKHDVEFVKFLLGRSPVLEVISISPDYEYGEPMRMLPDLIAHMEKISFSNMWILQDFDRDLLLYYLVNFNA
ncbi:FBD domain-containing protein [Heracleum sosnowskyi]|uniref:FBD domain-containing protein n=1 Tax=Heracleum sosnowskyi TaxID=360622 RepID=A0AAD8HXI0_9APIA|nr:FBD domain-containing protein [Heracleum sosnowskyi]